MLMWGRAKACLDPFPLLVAITRFPSEPVPTQLRSKTHPAVMKNTFFISGLVLKDQQERVVKLTEKEARYWVDIGHVIHT